MTEGFVSRGFVGKRRGGEKKDRLPPGQYLTNDFPVLSAGPTPHTPLNQWSFSIEGLVKDRVTWTWQEFLELPMQTYVVDISCVTKWTKLDMKWEGVSLDTLLEHVELDRKAMFVTAFSDGGYTPPTCPSPTLSTANPLSLSNMTTNHSHPRMAVPRAWSCRICISGRAPNGCAASV